MTAILQIFKNFASARPTNFYDPSVFVFGLVLLGCLSDVSSNDIIDNEYPGMPSDQETQYGPGGLDNQQAERAYGGELVVKMEPLMLQRSGVQSPLGTESGRAKRIGIFKINSEDEAPKFLSGWGTKKQKRVSKFHSLYFPGNSYTYMPDMNLMGDEGSLKRGIYHYVSGEDSQNMDKRIGIFHVRDDSEGQVNQKRGLYHKRL